MTFAQRVSTAVSMRRVFRFLLVAGAALAAVTVGWVALYRFVPPPGTPLMLIRMAEGAGIEKSWRDLDEISPNLAQAVIASEDSLFCSHAGFDWTSLRQ